MELEPDSIMKKIREWRKTGDFNDVTFVIGEHRIRAHKAVLAATVEYFDVMFRGDFREKNEDIIELKEVDPNGFELLLDYIYSQEIDLNFEVVKCILPVAVYYHVECLLQRIIEYVKSNIDVNNVFDYHLVTCSVNWDPLIQCTTKFAQENFLSAAKSKSFLKVTYSTVIEFIGNPETEIIETDKFEIIVNWISYDLDQRSKYLPELLKYICFKCMNRTFFIRTVLKHKLIINNYNRIKQIIEQSDLHQHNVGKITEIRVFGVNRWSQLIAVDICEKKLNAICTVSQNVDYDDFCTVVCKDTTYMSTFSQHTRANNLYYFKNYECILLKNSIANSNFLSMIYMDRFNSIFSNDSFILYRYYLEMNQMSSVGSLDFDGSIVGYENVIYTTGLFENKSIIYSYDPRVGRLFNFICKSKIFLSSSSSAILNDKMYTIGGGVMQVCDLKMNKCEIVLESDIVNSLACSLIAHENKLYVVSRKTIDIYDPTANMWNERISLNRSGETIFDWAIVSACKY